MLGFESLQMSSCDGALAGDGALLRLLAPRCDTGHFGSYLLHSDSPGFLPGLGLALVGLCALAWSYRIARKLGRQTDRASDNCRTENCHSPVERTRILGSKDWR